MNIKKLTDFPEFEGMDFLSQEEPMMENKLSISNVITLVSPEFDSIGVSLKTYNKHFNNPDSEYYQMTQQDILNKWEAKAELSRTYGKLLDKYIELSITDDEIEREMFELDNDVDGDTRLQGIINSFKEFDTVLSNNDDLFFIDRERSFYSVFDGFYIKGRFDALFYQPSKKKFLIVDWKSNEKIKCDIDKWTEHLLGAAKEYYNIDKDKYSIQLYYYKYALENILNKQFGENHPYTVDVCIVNLPGYVTETGNMYKTIKPSIVYDRNKLEAIFTYAMKKQQLINKRANESK